MLRFSFTALSPHISDRKPLTLSLAQFLPQLHPSSHRTDGQKRLQGAQSEVLNQTGVRLANVHLNCRAKAAEGAVAPAETIEARATVRGATMLPSKSVTKSSKSTTMRCCSFQMRRR